MLTDTSLVVDYSTKIKKRKQITTNMLRSQIHSGCRLQHKDKKKKANHNCPVEVFVLKKVVDYSTKIKKRKQITTYHHIRTITKSCRLQHKDKKKKANHNPRGVGYVKEVVVDYSTKIKKRKQITTLKQCL